MILKVIFMIGLTLAGTIGCFVYSPFYGVFVYYLNGVLRPQWIWDYALPSFAWSFYVAVCAIVSSFVMRPQVGTAAHMRLNFCHRSVLFFGFWVALSYVFARRHYSLANDTFVEYVKIFIMFYVASRVITSVSQLWNLYLMVATVLAYIAVEVNHIYVANNQYPVLFKRGFGGLDNNGAALMIAMGIPLCLYAWDGLRHWTRWLFLLAVPTQIHAVMTSYSRGAMLSALLLTPLYLLRFRHRTQLSVLLLLVGAAIPFLAGKEIQARFFSIESHDVDDSANSRKKSWAIAWQMACEEPLFGFGVRNSNLYTRAYGADMEGRTIHSQWLQIAADSGMVGMGAYIFAMVSSLYYLHRARRAVYDRTDDRARVVYTIACGCEASLILFSIGATFLSLETFELPYLLMLLSAQLWAVCESGAAAPPADGDESAGSAPGA